MVLVFNKNDRAFASDLNNTALMLKRAVRSGCEVTASSPADMNTNIASGQIIFDTTIIDVAPQAVTHDASDPSLDRYDLVVVDNTGTASIIKGTPAAVPQTPTYDPLSYVVLARVLVQDGVTAIPQSDIIDIRVISTGLIAGAGGIGRHITSFTSQTSLSINHGLGDDSPVVQVYDDTGEQITPDTIDIVDANNVDITFSTSTSGTVIIHGGESAFTGTTAFYQMNFVNQTTVNVPHNLGIEPVQVAVYDTSGNMIEPQSVTIVDSDNITVTFATSTSGTIAVSGGTTQVTVLGVKRYSESFTNETTGYVVNHNLNTSSPSVTVYDDSGNVIIPANIEATTPNVVTIDFSTNTSGTVEIQGGTQSTSPGAGTADLLPNVDDAFDIGSGTYRWKDAYFSGKLTVAGGIDPTYMNFTPTTTPALNNTLFVDSSDNELKWKDNSGTTTSVSYTVDDETIRIVDGKLTVAKDWLLNVLGEASGTVDTATDLYKATDVSPDTYATIKVGGTGGETTYFTFDMGEQKHIRAYQFKHDDSGPASGHFYFESSTDGSTWTTITDYASPGSITTTESNYDDTFRYFRVRFVAGASVAPTIRYYTLKLFNYEAF